VSALLAVALFVAVTAAQPSLATTRCAGPFSTPEAACPRCAARAVLRAPPVPWLEVRVLTKGNLEQPPSRENVVHHVLALRLPSGWWTQEIGRDFGFEEATSTSFPQSPEVRDLLPGGGAELTIEVDGTTLAPSSDGEARHQVDTRTLHICGLGRSGAPSCTEVETYRFAGSARGSRDTPVSFSKRGEVVVSGQADGDPIKPRRYRVVFP
jgi:hypothetical protein